MPNHRGSHASRAVIIFSTTHRIEVAALERAIAGGIARGSLGAATAEHYEEIAAETRLAIAEHAAAGKRLTGKLSSLAFRIAYNKTRDMFRRTRADALDRRRDSEAASIAYESARCEAETAEIRLTRLGETALKSALLRKALERTKDSDRFVLAAMLARETPMPRGDAAERKAANATAQAEKRARDRLTEAVGSASR
ncbi:hypothetical protein ILP92_17890 [Maribius pontilimi]|uniref:Uncharacterized protein n=1 Tax=Palleronia pontilimi TaxID=1964209 RepID=A0A934IKH4_9RHOB|nr:hypothetical protein [Palleronia pontilimi]MBJ3764608.1 hypothetical protein [Palleronia pontilimi]